MQRKFEGNGVGSPLPREYTAPVRLGVFVFCGLHGSRTEAESLKSQGCDTEGTREVWDGFATSLGIHSPREFGGFVFCGLHGSRTEAEYLKSQGCDTEKTREEWDGFMTSQGIYRPR